MIKFDKKKFLENPEVVKEYASLRLEYTIARALIKARSLLTKDEG